MPHYLSAFHPKTSAGNSAVNVIFLNLKKCKFQYSGKMSKTSIVGPYLRWIIHNFYQIRLVTHIFSDFQGHFKKLMCGQPNF